MRLFCCCRRQLHLLGPRQKEERASGSLWFSLGGRWGPMRPWSLSMASSRGFASTSRTCVNGQSTRIRVSRRDTGDHRDRETQRDSKREAPTPRRMPPLFLSADACARTALQHVEDVSCSFSMIPQYTIYLFTDIYMYIYRHIFVHILCVYIRIYLYTLYLYISAACAVQTLNWSLVWCSRTK